MFAKDIYLADLFGSGSFELDILVIDEAIALPGCCFWPLLLASAFGLCFCPLLAAISTSFALCGQHLLQSDLQYAD